MEFSKDDLVEAKRQIDSTLHKLRETVKTLEAKENKDRYKSQINLAKNRIKAFGIANSLIEQEIEETPLQNIIIKFPDKNFEKAIRVEIGKPKGDITKNDVKNITELDLRYQNIENLSSIEYLSELKRLDCSYRKLKKLDLSKNTKLEKLSCSDNELSSLNVSKNANLKELSCNDNKLTGLDLGKNTKIDYLNCRQNNFPNKSAITGLDKLDFLGVFIKFKPQNN